MAEWWFMEPDAFHAFIRELGERFMLYAPTRRGGTLTFTFVENYEDVELTKRPLTSPKGAFLPQTEVLLKFSLRGERVHLSPAPRPESPIAVVGIRPCEAWALKLLDPVFSSPPEDVHYTLRRESALLVGFACTSPGRWCFCTSLGSSPFGDDGLDVLLVEVSGGHCVMAVTERGRKALEVVRDMLRKADEALLGEIEERRRQAERAMKKVDVERFITCLEDMGDDPMWEEIAARCIGCGICTYLCPTCYCFDIQDEAGLTSGRRVRVWDSCMYPEYTLEASGHNPRPRRVHRVKNRVYHKFRWYVDLFGLAGCVGCGRCAEHCPVNVDIREIILQGVRR